MSRKLAAVAVAALLVAALAVTVTLVQHESARATWDAESARVDEADYSAEDSDRLYAEVDALRARTRSLTWALALTLFLAAWSVSESDSGRRMFSGIRPVVNSIGA